MATMDQASNSLPPNKHFYRRTLPSSCISFSSDKGKQLFREALLSGHMECYFKLASQFRTQDEPAFCGLSTMVMVLNALDVDPGRVWKGVWRWYHENMLDCCVPLEIVEQRGINFEQFICVAKCNSLTVDGTRMTEAAMSLSMFRELVEEYTKVDDKFIVLSYSRKVLDQTGDGHFSPLAGYNPKEDMVLMLDTARFKYPPHWVKTELIFRAMKAIDQSTGKPRGLMLLSRSENSQHLLLFRLASNLSMTAPEKFIPDFMVKWKQELERRTEEELDPDAFCHKSAKTMIDILAESGNSGPLMTTQLDVACPQDVTNDQHCLVYQLLKALKETTVFKKVSEILKSLEEEQRERVIQFFDMTSPPGTGTCNACSTLVCEHFIAFLLLSWPYKLHCVGEDSLASRYSEVYADQTHRMESYVLLHEVSVLRGQLEIIIKTVFGSTVTVGACSNKCCKRMLAKPAC